jgi:hypothetical protein
VGNVRFTSPYKEYSDASLNPPTQTHLHTSSTISRPSHVSSSATSSPQYPPHTYLPSTNLAFPEPPTAAAPNSLPPHRQIRSQAQPFAVVDTMSRYLHQVRGEWGGGGAGGGGGDASFTHVDYTHEIVRVGFININDMYNNDTHTHTHTHVGGHRRR